MIKSKSRNIETVFWATVCHDSWKAIHHSFAAIAIHLPHTATLQTTSKDVIWCIVMCQNEVNNISEIYWTLIGVYEQQRAYVYVLGNFSFISSLSFNLLHLPQMLWHSQHHKLILWPFHHHQSIMYEIRLLFLLFLSFVFLLFIIQFP